MGRCVYSAVILTVKEVALRGAEAPAAPDRRSHVAARITDMDGEDLRPSQYTKPHHRTVSRTRVLTSDPVPAAHIPPRDPGGDA